jgi:hypothetical protein
METGEIAEKNYRQDDTYTKDFWLPILKSKTFRTFIENKYMMATGSIMSDQELNDIYGED